MNGSENKPADSLSSPSSGANIIRLLDAEPPASLPLNLPRGRPGPDVQRQAWQALAAAARALEAVASAMAGEAAPPFPTHTLTVAPMPAANAIRCDLRQMPSHPVLHHQALAGCPSIVEAVNELLKSKARAGRSDGYLKILRTNLKRFAAQHPGRQLDDVSAAEVERWIDRLDFSDRHRLGHLESVRLLFSFGVRRGYVARNPAAAVELPADSARLRPPVVHTPEQVATVLEAVRAAGEANLCRFLAVRYFAGLRSSEVQRLRPEHIRADGLIEVPAHVAKTRRRRLVTIEPALAAWLALGGELPVRDLHTRMARVEALAGVPWSPGVTRHSFVSYHLAQYESAAKTALQAGHSEAMLFEHYRALVTKEAAGAFWAIRPRA
jgi:integrase